MSQRLEAVENGIEEMRKILETLIVRGFFLRLVGEESLNKSIYRGRLLRANQLAKQVF
jgi:KaiC/GvpD/RAD55 family RecA-like ATPase